VSLRTLLAAIALPAALVGEGPPKPATLLSVGDVAPPLEIATWVKGDAVREMERGRIYVIDFWYTWCGPCVAGMPHMTSVQSRHAKDGVVVLGVTSEDRFGSTLESIRALVEKKGDAVAYSIGVDAANPGGTAHLGVFSGQTVSRYLAGAGIQSVPCAFVVDRDGRIAWIGHPLSVDEPLAAIASGRWDLPARAAEYRSIRDAEPKLARLAELAKKGEREAVVSLARELADGPLARNARGLQAIGEALVAAKVDSAPDLAFALDVATRAVDLTASGDPGMLSTLARVRARRGEIDLAITTQKRAVEISEGEARAAQEGELRKLEALRGGR